MPITKHHLGPLMMLGGAFLFAGSHVIAKAAYARGLSQVALFVLRGLVIYAMNGALEAYRSGSESARRVLLLSVANRRFAGLAVLRSVAGFCGISVMNISFQMMHLADTFALTLGTMSLATVALARVVVGAAESLSARAFAGGAIALLGILLVTQPEALFGGEPPSAAAVTLTIVAGLLFSICNVLSRVLGRTGDASPSMLLSYFMVVVGCGSAVIALTAHVALGDEKAPSWATFSLPNAADAGLVWFLVALYCVGILSGQLLLAAGYAVLPAWFASILALTELSFSWSLDVFVLREPTNALACSGTLVIFVGCALAATGSRKASTAAARTTTSSFTFARPAPLAKSDSASAVDEAAWVVECQPAQQEACRSTATTERAASPPSASLPPPSPPTSPPPSTTATTPWAEMVVVDKAAVGGLTTAQAVADGCAVLVVDGFATADECALVMEAASAKAAAVRAGKAPSQAPGKLSASLALRLEHSTAPMLSPGRVRMPVAGLSAAASQQCDAWLLRAFDLVEHEAPDLARPSSSGPRPSRRCARRGVKKDGNPCFGVRRSQGFRIHVAGVRAEKESLSNT